MLHQYLEREVKFDVPDHFEVPELDGVVSDSIETDTQTLTATYYDTEHGHLQRNGITLRRRSGGHDDGWHVKIPTGNSRLELQVESRATTPPREISELLMGVRLGQSLRPRARLETRRTRNVILDGHGDVLAEIADDRVHSWTIGDTASLDEWREVEVELGSAGDEELLRQLQKALSNCGAKVSDHASKYMRAVGPPPTVKGPKRLARLVDDYLQTQRDALADGDLRMRRDENVVHTTRVAVRRTRSTLRVFANLFDAERAAHLDAELLWYANVLGRVRDLDIVSERLSNQLDGPAADLATDPVRADLESWLANERASAWEALQAALRGRRYRRLLMDLDDWQWETPWTENALDRKSAATAYVERAEQKATKRLRDAVSNDGSYEDFHRARKATKRWRYALELCSPHVGKRAESQVAQLRRLQDDLGDLQDTVMSRDVLRRMAISADSAVGERAFAYGLLYAHEDHRGAKARRSIAQRYG